MTFEIIILTSVLIAYGFPRSFISPKNDERPDLSGRRYVCRFDANSKSSQLKAKHRPDGPCDALALVLLLHPDAVVVGRFGIIVKIGP